MFNADQRRFSFYYSYSLVKKKKVMVFNFSKGCFDSKLFPMTLSFYKKKQDKNDRTIAKTMQ